ncbi:MAG: CpXC domain-containing protein [Clostridiales bacterium]|nr:CpXC domain-containing protein [Clostridiales bacterium]
MAQRNTATLTCPICKKDHEVPLWRKIDVQEKPDAKKALLEGTFFDFSCPDCGYESRLHYGSLYVDAALREMIYISETEEESVADAERAAAQLAQDSSFYQKGDSLLRIVRSAEDLKEKLLIFENGLDDRLVEMCKGVALSQFPGEEDYYVTDIRYDVIGEQELLRLTCSDETEQYVLDFAGLYEQLYGQFGALLPPLRGSGFTQVDLEYAAELMRGIAGGMNR